MRKHRSSHWASSGGQISGRFPAASDSRLKTARPTRNLSGCRSETQTERDPQRIALRRG
ncbi:MAG TPA: hypothetical protein VNO25_21070 [Streptosporangiaceae bacterium]|nr:hypothetical protein [Streptosporangiaceae bacterium]